MIRVQRGTEPPGLAAVRATQLQRLHNLGREPRSDEIKGYDIVKDDLWRAQHQKCCYCDYPEQRSYNAVEHYRPKGGADRQPGSGLRHSYWWLAFTWDNLLFSCPRCNSSAKGVRFPLMRGSGVLTVGQAAPGKERPLLLDPAGTTNPAEHISFRPDGDPWQRGIQWLAVPRNGSPMGAETIDVLKLNYGECHDLRIHHIDEEVREPARTLREALEQRDQAEALRAFRAALQLVRPTSKFVVLTADALRALVPPVLLRRDGLAWPTPDKLPRPLPTRAPPPATPVTPATASPPSRGATP